MEAPTEVPTEVPTEEESVRVGFAKMAEAAKFLAVSPSYLHRLIQQGRVPSSRIGSQHRIAWAWLYEQERIATGKTAEVAS